MGYEWGHLIGKLVDISGRTTDYFLISAHIQKICSGTPVVYVWNASIGKLVITISYPPVGHDR